MNKTFLVAFLSSVFMFHDTNAAVTAGSIVFLGFNQDEAEHFAFVATTAISAGEVIKFTDSAYGNNVAGQEDKFRWTEHLNVSPTPGPLVWTSGAITAGTVIIYDDTDGRFELGNGTPIGTTSGLAMDFSTSGDNIFAYQGTITDLGGSNPYRGDSSGVSFVGGVQVGSSWLAAGAGSTSLNYLPGQLTNGSTAFDYASTLDNFRYNGPRAFTDWSSALAAINLDSNWTGHDTTTSAPSDFGPDFTIGSVPEPNICSQLILATALLGRMRRRKRHALKELAPS